MTFSADFWTTNLADEPCDGCGVSPSKHAGHGSFTCESCYAKWWCPKCKYALSDSHVCRTSEQQAADRVEFNAYLVSIGEAPLAEP